MVRESDPRRDTNPSWLASEQRLTVSTMGTRIQALCQGLGFAWSPILKITRELESGLLKPLPLARGLKRVASLYIVVTDQEGAGPVTRALEHRIREQVTVSCDEQSATGRSRY